MTTKRVVFVHGRAQERKDARALQASWEAAWQTGMTAATLSAPIVTVGFPYYGDRLVELLAQVEGPPVSGISLRGPEAGHPDPSLQGEILMELARAEGIGDDEIARALATGAPNRRGPENWAWVQAIFRVLDERGLGTSTIATFLRDVDAYMSYPAVRAQIDAIVEAAIGTGADVVVGHSLGSVVAYNVLRTTRARVGRYVTVGSPLGLRAIRDRLRPTVWPAGTGDWKNAYDDRDVVALNPLSAPYFDATRPIENRSDVDNGTPNRHGIDGYLSDAGVARWIHEALM